MKKSILIYSFFILLAISCRKEEFTDSPDAKLNFSTEEVFFDTIFTTVGSMTRNFTVHNSNDKFVRISEIALAGGEDSYFRINIDGRPAKLEKDLELAPGDSLYIFADVTIKNDPNGTLNPFVIKDSLRFKINGNTQYVRLKAFGRNVYLHRSERVSGFTSWQTDRPHLIVNYVLVDSNSTLAIPKGTEVHGTSGSGIYVFGTLEVQGTTVEPVIFEGDRVHNFYKDMPGQWDGIRLLTPSRDNILINAIVREARVGLTVDSLRNNDNPKVVIRNSQFYHNSVAGIGAFTGDILAINTVVSHNCGNQVVGDFGGHYEFYHCTINATSCECSPGSTSLVLTDRKYENPRTNESFSFPLEFVLFNSIVWGPKEEEIILSYTRQPTSPPVIISNILKTKEEGYNVNNNILNQDPQLTNPCKNNFSLLPTSPALNAGDTISQLPILLLDLEGKPRNPYNPDLGAIED